jgi:hypothetical protein
MEASAIGNSSSFLGGFGACRLAVLGWRFDGKINLLPFYNSELLEQKRSAIDCVIGVTT